MGRGGGKRGLWAIESHCGRSEDTGTVCSWMQLVDVREGQTQQEEEGDLVCALTEGQTGRLETRRALELFPVSPPPHFPLLSVSPVWQLAWEGSST